MSNSRSSTVPVHLVVLGHDPDLRAVAGLQERGGGQRRDFRASASARRRRWRRGASPAAPKAARPSPRRSRGAVGHRRDLADGAGDRHLGLRLQPYLDLHAGRNAGDICAGDGEDRLALGVARDLDDHLPGLHDLPRIRAGRGDDAIVRGEKLGSRAGSARCEDWLRPPARPLGAAQRLQRSRRRPTAACSPCRRGCDRVPPGRPPG